MRITLSLRCSSSAAPVHAQGLVGGIAVDSATANAAPLRRRHARGHDGACRRPRPDDERRHVPVRRSGARCVPVQVQRLAPPSRRRAGRDARSVERAGADLSARVRERSAAEAQAVAGHRGFPAGRPARPGNVHASPTRRSFREGHRGDGDRALRGRQHRLGDRSEHSRASPPPIRDSSRRCRPICSRFSSSRRVVPAVRRARS